MVEIRVVSSEVPVRIRLAAQLASMVEMVDTLLSKGSASGRFGSTPNTGTLDA